MRGLTNEQIIKLHGSVSNIPGDCNRQRIQTDLDGEAATALRNKLKVYRSDQENMNSFAFLSTHFPDTYEEQFTVNSDGEVQIREGGVLLGTAIKQFYSKLLTPSEIPSLGFSLIGMLMSIILSAGSAYSLWIKSKEEDMLMSYSDQILAERQDLLNGYSEKLEISQRRRRNQLNSGNGGN